MASRLLRLPTAFSFVSSTSSPSFDRPNSMKYLTMKYDKSYYDHVAGGGEIKCLKVDTKGKLNLLDHHHHDQHVNDRGEGFELMRNMSPSLGTTIIGDNKMVTTAVGTERGVVVKDLGMGEVGRVRVAVLTAVALCLCNANRSIMAVVAVPLAARHGWTNSMLGIVQSSFLWGYFFASIAGGAMVDRYGGKTVMIWGVALWSLASLLTPYAADHSISALLLVRTLFGLAAGVAIPSMNAILSEWFPSDERATAVGISMAGFHLGNVMSLLLTPPSISMFGDAGPFILFSSLGLAWMPYWLQPAGPQHQSKLSLSSSNFKAELIEKKRDQPPNLSQLFSKLPTWAIIFANFTNNWGYFVLLSWMPIYFKMVFDINLKQAAWFSAIPWGMMAVSGYIAGLASDSLILSGAPITFVRKVMQSIGFIGPAISLLCLNSAKTPSGAAVWLTIALSLSSFSQAGFLLNMQDIAPQCAGLLHGISNSIGTLAAIVSTIGTGYFVQWLGSFRAFLTLTACLYVVTAAFWNLFATADRVF